MLFIIWALLIVFVVAFCATGSKPDSMALRFSGTAPKPKLRVSRTVLPDKRLKRNDWYKYIHESRNEIK